MGMWTMAGLFVLGALLSAAAAAAASWLWLTWRDRGKFKDNSKENYDTERSS